MDEKITIIGSDNVNCRSMPEKCDSEIDVRVEDPGKASLKKLNKFLRRLREAAQQVSEFE